MEIVVISIEQLRVIIKEELGKVALKQTATNAEKSYLSVKELGAYLHLSVPAIYKKVSEDEIPHHSIGSRILFEQSEIDQWIAQK